SSGTTRVCGRRRTTASLRQQALGRYGNRSTVARSVGGGTTRRGLEVSCVLLPPRDAASLDASSAAGISAVSMPSREARACVARLAGSGCDGAMQNQTSPLNPFFAKMFYGAVPDVMTREGRRGHRRDDRVPPRSADAVLRDLGGCLERR